MNFYYPKELRTLIVDNVELRYVTHRCPRDGNNKGIDVVQFETTVKVGKQGVIDLNPEIYQTKEQIKQQLIEATSSNVTDYNPQVVHALPYEDYMLVQPVPSHYMDTTNGFGTQIRKLIIA